MVGLSENQRDARSHVRCPNGESRTEEADDELLERDDVREDDRERDEEDDEDEDATDEREEEDRDNDDLLFCAV